ncbi:hypothetical protein SAMN06296416_1311 [Pseudoxanthomonas wuyuanensis]|uniref:Uncharacterized protein n=1 Tax=Pseudoxanthomonas wuyuanensis TaxID=1073196 RepID=A0A286DH79_9GAMM|nr:hypothetical protein SAMN06296416_1311 [Pseudoxanthomonas wuyuanensis]
MRARLERIVRQWVAGTAWMMSPCSPHCRLGECATGCGTELAPQRRQRYAAEDKGSERSGVMTSGGEVVTEPKTANLRTTPREPTTGRSLNWPKWKAAMHLLHHRLTPELSRPALANCQIKAITMRARLERIVRQWVAGMAWMMPPCSPHCRLRRVCHRLRDGACPAALAAVCGRRQRQRAQRGNDVRRRSSDRTEDSEPEDYAPDPTTGMLLNRPTWEAAMHLLHHSLTPELSRAAKRLRLE